MSNNNINDASKHQREMSKEELIKRFYKTCQSEKIELDNLDYAKLIINEQGEVVVENEHGTQFGIDELSKSEIECFYANL